MSLDSLARLESIWQPGTPAIAPELFADDQVYQAEIEKIFRGPFWHMVGHVSEFPAVGDYKTHRIGDVPVIVLRSTETFRVVVNACAHRGAQLLTAARGSLGDTNVLTCVYHRWEYDLDAAVVAVGRPRGYDETFQAQDYCLAQAHVAVVGGVIFASLGVSPPSIEDYLGETMMEHIKQIYESVPLNYLGVQRAVFQCNWKLYIENIYDSYHAITLHKALRLMRIKKPSPHLEDPGILRYGHYLSVYEAELPDAFGLANPELFESRTRATRATGHVISNIFPASQMNEQLDVLAIRLVVPRGPAATEIQFHVFGRETDDDEIRQHRVWQAANFVGPQGLVNLEDAAVLARVQAAMTGRNNDLGVQTGRRFPGRRKDEAAMDAFYGFYREILLNGYAPSAADKNSAHPAGAALAQGGQK